jgi:thymidylate synthase (FAD)
MKPNFISPSVQRYECTDLLQHVERCGRVAYRSEDRITEGSAQRFFDDVVLRRGHGSVAEHAAVTFRTSHHRAANLAMLVDGPTPVTTDMGIDSYVTLNVRQIMSIDEKLRTILDIPELGLAGSRGYVRVPACTTYEREHHVRRTYHITCSRACAQQITRHRVASFTMESQRYVNYEKKGIDIIDDGSRMSDEYYQLMCDEYERRLTTMKPEHARDVLCNSVATRLVVTMSEHWWDDFLRQRLDVHAQDEIRLIAGMIRDDAHRKQ